LVLSEKTALTFSSLGVLEMLLFIDSELEGILRSEEFGDCVVLPGDRDTDADSLWNDDPICEWSISLGTFLYGESVLLLD